MATKRVLANELNRDEIPAGFAAGLGSDENLRPSTAQGTAAHPTSVSALVSPSPIALDDVDRVALGVATGNMITGANTMTGSAGKDHGGSGALSIASAIGTVNLTYGDITIDAKGNYTYTRTVAMDALPANAVDTLSYVLVDSKAQTSNNATLTLVLNPAIQTTSKFSTDDPPTNGSAYDEVIQYKTPVFSFGHVNGLGGDDLLKSVAVGVPVYLDGGTGSDTLIGTATTDVLIGGAGADKLDGGSTGSEFASYETSTKSVAFNLLTGLGTLGDAVGDTMVHITGLFGGKANDVLIGDGNRNDLRGGAGNDELHGGGNSDTLSGEAGNDTLYGEDLNDNFLGGLGNDNLFGGNGDDTFYGEAGADHLDGGADTDLVYYIGTTIVVVDIGNPSKSTGDAKGDVFTSIEIISGGSNNDTLIAGADSIALRGEFGDDKLVGGAGVDTLLGEDGNDTLIGNGGDSLSGGAGNDVLISGAGADALDGGADFDYASYATAKAAVAADINFGGLDGDALLDIFANIEGFIGSAFADSFYGNTGIDTFFGGAGDDQLFGQNNDDTLIGGAGADTLDGGSDTDSASYIDSKAVTVDLTDTLKNTGDAKGDTYIAIEIFEGSNFGDKLIGDANANAFKGGLGADKIAGGGGGDTLNGDDGNDTVSGEADNDSIHGGIGDDKLDGGTGLDSLFGDDGNDTLLGGDGIDNLHGGIGNDKLDGGIGNDVLSGDNGDDSLAGSIGNDKLVGGGGNDTLDGASGNDTLTGGAGADTFLFFGGGTDKVTDFNAADDFINLGSLGGSIQNLVDSGFTAVSAGSTLTIGQNGTSEMVISGWTGGQVLGDIQTVAEVLGSHLIY